MNPILKHIKNTQIVVTAKKWYVAMTINIQNQFNLMEVKMQFINAWRKCSMKLDIAET